MNSIAYSAMIEQMDKGAYTEVTAKNTLTVMFAKQMLAKEEYDELMDKATDLSVNTDAGEVNIRLVALEKDVSTLKEQVAALMEGSNVEGPTETEPKPDGSEHNPITTYRGMTYYKDKYYKDSEDNQVYLCTRDSDSEPGTGVSLNYLPHELVNIYFNYVRLS